MQGYCCLERDGEVYHGFIAWDAAGAPDAHRRARVRSWYDALAAADHWGSGQLPPILLVCPGRAQERVWRDAIVSTARRRDAYPLSVAVTTPEAAGSDDVLGEWYWLDEEATLTIEDVLVPRKLQPPLTAPRPRLDLIDRGVSIKTPTLHEWAQQVLAADPAPATRDGDAARSMALSQAHRRILPLVVRHPYLTERQMAELLGEAVEPVRQLLIDLERYGLLSSVALPGTHN